MGDLLPKEHKSTDAGKIHLTKEDEENMALDRAYLEGLYAVPHQNRPKPQVPQRTSSFNATKEIKKALSVSSDGTPTGQALQVHDHPPSGYRANQTKAQTTFGKTDNIKGTIIDNPLNNVALSVSTPNSLLKDITSNRTTHPTLPSSGRDKTRHVSELSSVGSPTTVSEDDTTTSGSYIVESWEMPNLKRPNAPSPIDTKRITPTEVIQQALV